MANSAIDPYINQLPQLRAWVLLRSFILFCLWMAFGYFMWRRELGLAWPWVLPYLSGLTLFNLLTYWRLKRELPVSAAEFFIQLLIVKP